MHTEVEMGYRAGWILPFHFYWCPAQFAIFAQVTSQNFGVDADSISSDSSASGSQVSSKLYSASRPIQKAPDFTASSHLQMTAINYHYSVGVVGSGTTQIPHQALGHHLPTHRMEILHLCACVRTGRTISFIRRKSKHIFENLLANWHIFLPGLTHTPFPARN